MIGIDDLNRTERIVLAGVVALTVGLVAAVFAGIITASYLFSLLALAGMYILLTLGLNVQWGYAGLINFSVAAFYGLGAYSAALVTSSRSPLGLEAHPIYGVLLAVVVSAVVAVLIGIPTLRLRADYLAIATLGLAEVIRLLVLNERDWTRGSAGVTGIPRVTDWMPVSFVPFDSGNFRNFLLILGLVILAFLFLRRIHRSPWGRVLRTIRADEDLAEALGKNAYRFKMQAFVIGAVLMALGGVFYAHLNLFVTPGDLDPIYTFYVWIAVIIGGTGSDRGALLGGLIVVAILEGTRFLVAFLEFVLGFVLGVLEATRVLTPVVEYVGDDPSAWLAEGPLRLVFVGLLIVFVVRFRSQGILPPQRELIWPGAGAYDVAGSGPGFHGDRDVDAGPRTERDTPLGDDDPDASSTGDSDAASGGDPGSSTGGAGGASDADPGEGGGDRRE